MFGLVLFGFSLGNKTLIDLFGSGRTVKHCFGRSLLYGFHHIYLWGYYLANPNSVGYPLYALTHGMQEWYPHRLCAVLFIQSGLHGCAGLQRPKASSSPCFKFVRSLEKKRLDYYSFYNIFSDPVKYSERYDRKDMTNRGFKFIEGFLFLTNRAR